MFVAWGFVIFNASLERTMQSRLIGCRVKKVRPLALCWKLSIYKCTAMQMAMKKNERAPIDAACTTADDLASC
jgi:hypothetical protein